MNDVAPAAADGVIEARALQVCAGTKTLLRDVAVTIARGERVALVGHNGAGKSTLLRTFSGHRGSARITRGSMRVLDTHLTEPGSNAALRCLRSRVAQVHQGLHLIDRLSAIDNVLIGGAGRHSSAWTWLRRWPEHERRRAQAVLVRVGLGEHARRRTDSLSGGERQKVAIARALHQGAPLLLADEPTASLDADAADEVAALLADVAREHRSTLVCVVHDLDLLPRLAERAIALRHGIVVADVLVDQRTPAQLRGLLK